MNIVINKVAFASKEKYLFFFIVILFWVTFLLNLFCGELTNIYNGCGFDGGMFYAPIVKNFWGIAGSNGFDSYSFGKILPQFLIASFAYISNVPVNDQIIILGYKIIHFIAIAISWIYVLKYCKEKQMGFNSKSLLIILLFINYPILKLVGFVPVSPDATVYAMSIIIAYYYLTTNIKGLFFTTLVGMFLIPGLLIFYLPLFIFKTTAIHVDTLKRNKLIHYGSVLGYSLIGLGITFITFSFLYHWDIYYDEKFFSALYSGREEATLFTFFPLSLIIAGCYVYFALYGFCYYYKFYGIVASIQLNGIASWIILFSIYYILTLSFVDSTLPQRASYSVVFIKLFTSSLQFPAHFILAKIFYFGPVAVFIIFLWRQLTSSIIEKGFGLILYTVVFLAFNLLSESRGFLQLLPIYIFLLIQNLKNLKIKQILIAFAISAILSRFWFHIGYLQGELYGDSMQRFQIGNGFFNSIKSYCISSTSALITIVIIYFAFINNRVKTIPKSGQN